MRTLGARLAPLGTMEKELEYRTEQCNKWSQAMLESNLTKRDACKAYHNVLIPKINCTLAITTMTQMKLKGMQVIVDKVYLPKVGLNRHFPLEILYGTSVYGGIGHKTLYNQQGIAQLKLHIGSIRNNEDSAKLITTSLEIAQLESGLGTPIMGKNTTKPFGVWTEPTLNHSIKRFLCRCSAELKYTNLWCPKK